MSVVARREEEDSSESGYRILDKTSGNYLIEFADGSQDVVNRTITNELLYEEGMWDFLDADEGEEVQVLSDEDSAKYVAIAPTSETDVFTLWYGNPNNPVLTPSSRSVEILYGLKDALEGNFETLSSEYRRVFNTHVDKRAVNQLVGSFPDVEAKEHGWQIEGIFFVTWQKEVYRSPEDIDKESIVRQGSSVGLAGESRESLKLELPSESVLGDEITYIEEMESSFGKEEIEFLGKVLWLLKRREYFDDESFWSGFEE